MVNGPRPASDDKEKKASAGAPRFTLKPSKQTCIILGSMMAAVILGGAGLYFWQSGEIAEKQAILKQKREEVAQGQKIAQQLTQLETEYSAMQGQLRFLEKSVEGREFAPTMVKQLEEEARRVNLSVISFRGTIEKSPPKPTDKEALKTWKPWPYDKLHVDVEVNGSYWNISRFLYRLTEFRKIVAVESTSISPILANGVYASNLSAKMNLTGFIFPVEEKAVEDQAQPGTPTPESSPAPGVKQSARGGNDNQTSGGA